MKPTWPFAALALLLLSPVAHAQDATTHPHKFRDKFEAANTSHDGHLTLGQAQAGNMPQVARFFNAIDADHKGYVTLADIRTFRRARRAAQGLPPNSAAGQK